MTPELAAPTVRTDVAAVELTGLTKSFAGTRALHDVDLTLGVGEVHGLLGHNGSGKSTLIKVLSGYHVPDSGSLRLYGEEQALPLPAGRAYQAGINFVYQDLGLLPSVSVAENFAIQRISQARGPYFSLAAESRRAQAVLDRYGLDVRASRRVAELAPEQRAMVAVLRALDGLSDADNHETHGRPGVLILDEPTVFLSREATETFLALVRDVAASGVSVLLVSHNIDEVLAVTDRLTVLRDGEVARVAETASLTKHEVAEAIVGHEIGPVVTAPRSERSYDSAVSVSDLRYGDDGAGIDLEIGAGEVVGVTGLGGAGHEALVYALFGALPTVTGRLVVRGTSVDLAGASPRRMVRLGVALLPADRPTDAALLDISLTDNVTMTRLPAFRGPWGLRRRAMSSDTGRLLDRFEVKPPTPAALLGSLSGGNQQKVMFAKWTAEVPALLLLHEPTQGVDIGAREQIWSVVRTLADSGVAVLCAGSDHDELAALSDRVVVMNAGRISTQLIGSQITPEAITLACYAEAEPTSSTSDQED